MVIKKQKKKHFWDSHCGLEAFGTFWGPRGFGSVRRSRYKKLRMLEAGNMADSAKRSEDQTNKKERRQGQTQRLQTGRPAIGTGLEAV